MVCHQLSLLLGWNINLFMEPWRRNTRGMMGSTRRTSRHLDALQQTLRFSVSLLFLPPRPLLLTSVLWRLIADILLSLHAGKSGSLQNVESNTQICVFLALLHLLTCGYTLATSVLIRASCHFSTLHPVGSLQSRFKRLTLESCTFRFYEPIQDVLIFNVLIPFPVCSS